MPQHSSQPAIVGTGPQALVQAFHDFIRTGPCLQIEIHIPDVLAQQLQAAGLPVPAPVAGKALVDTGASISGIDESHAQALGLKSIATVQCSTPTGTKVQQVYAVKFEFPGSTIPVTPLLTVLGNEIKNQGIDVLLGRDYLGDKVLIYNGPMRLYTICF